MRTPKILTRSNPFRGRRAKALYPVSLESERSMKMKTRDKIKLAETVRQNNERNVRE